jgi:ATP phosphoribosyltransferase
VEEIMPISARLIINQAALKLKRKTIQPMLDAFSAAIEECEETAAQP